MRMAQNDTQQTQFTKSMYNNCMVFYIKCKYTVGPIPEA